MEISIEHCYVTVTETSEGNPERFFFDILRQDSISLLTMQRK